MRQPVEERHRCVTRLRYLEARPAPLLTLEGERGPACPRSAADHRRRRRSLGSAPERVPVRERPTPTAVTGALINASSRGLITWRFTFGFRRRIGGSGLAIGACIGGRRLAEGDCVHVDFDGFALLDRLLPCDEGLPAGELLDGACGCGVRLVVLALVEQALGGDYMQRCVEAAWELEVAAPATLVDAVCGDRRPLLARP